MKRKAMRCTAFAVVACALMLVPVASASASAGGIRKAVRTWSGPIDIAEGHALTAIGEYQEDKNPVPVEAAIAETIKDLEGLKASVARQSAKPVRVAKAKRKIEAGVHSLITAYQHLSTAYGVKAENPQAATEEADTALVEIKRALKELKEGAKLLK